MPAWEHLAEARIQEWLRRPAKTAPKERAPEASVPPLELQLVEDILRLYGSALKANDEASKAALRRQATELEARLMILLEKSSRPLAAQHFAALLQQARSEAS